MLAGYWEGPVWAGYWLGNLLAVYWAGRWQGSLLTGYREVQYRLATGGVNIFLLWGSAAMLVSCVGDIWG